MTSTQTMKEVSFALPHLTLAGWTNDNVGKPVLLALHGWLDNAGSFEPLLPYLQDYHVVAVDLPGHGLSDHRSADAHYHFVDWAYDVAELIAHQQWQDLLLLGHSMGGMIASVVAAVLPEKIKQLVLIEAIGLITTDQESACDQLRQAIKSRQLLRNKSSAVHQSFDTALAARVTVSDFTDEEARLLLKRGLKQTPAGFVWRSDQRLRTHSAMRFSIEQAKSFVTNVQCRVLLIEGKSELALMVKNRALYQPFYVNLDYCQVSGGHHCHMEHPAQVWQKIAEFVA